MQSPKAIVIGSGVAGLAIAVRLAVQGFAVTVFEKNAYAGGKLYAFKKDGYTFDAGPSLFVDPANITELFKLADEPVEKYLSYKKVDIACRYFYEDDAVIQSSADNKSFAMEMQNKTGEHASHIEAYLKSSKKLYQDIGEIFLHHSLHKRKTWLQPAVVKAFASVKPAYLFASLNKFNSKRFNTQHAQQLFNRFATYNGSNPFTAPAMLSLIAHAELNEGVYYPEGGMASITNALYQLALNKNVAFVFDTIVQRIIVHNGKALGVVVNDENIFADVVVSDVDIHLAYTNLLNDKRTASNLLKQERSSSALVFYWGINKTFQQLGLHNILFSKDYAAEFDHLFKKKLLFDDPTVYINITSKEEAAHAPDGKENWFVMINAPYNNGQDWQSLQQEARDNIIRKINRILSVNLKAYIETEQVLTPAGIETETLSFMGAIYGTSSNTKMAAFMRHANFSKAYQRLYFVGGTVHPGGGIPLCLKGAAITADLIATDKKKWKEH
jgi:phytoene desaturase